MALTLAQLWTQPTKAAIKQKVIDTAALVGLPVDLWPLGGASERWAEIIPRVLDEFLSAIIVQSAKWFFLDSATDPGDEGDANATPGEGALSGLGQGRFGTTRRGQTFATTTIEVTNNNPFTVTPKPGEIVVQRDEADDDGTFPTYTTVGDATVYTNLDGTVTILAGSMVELPIRADVAGTYSNAGDNEITVLVTGTFGSLAVTNPTATTGSEREHIDDYRERCRRATARGAAGGPTELYRYAANTDLNGDPLQRHNGTGAVSITRVFVDDFTTAGIVAVFVADEDGPSEEIDVESAHANITGIPEGIITEPYGVVPGGVIYSTAAATAQVVTIAGTAKIKLPPGVTEDDIVDAIEAALTEYFKTIPLGGLDQTLGSGFLYRNDLEAVVKAAYPGLYAVDITTPATSTVTVSYARVCTLTFGSWTISLGSGP